ncbi:mitochondrial 30S ribosomal protein S12 [Flagelloscypha sp. PMI_526]|nr:mitochondrial 30S ribosomal protein S12 [Flagelloscypha sp. PMI_526]
MLLGPLSRTYLTALPRLAAVRHASPSLLHQPMSRLPLSSPILSHLRQFHVTTPALMTMNQSMKRKKKKLRRTVLTRSPLLKNCPQKKGVCTAVFTASPKKPNSGKRKVAKIKLSTGEMCQAYIPGEGHNLQEHSVVMVRGGRAQDVPGVLYKVVRGVLDTGAVVNRRTSRSRYGGKKPKS